MSNLALTLSISTTNSTRSLLDPVDSCGRIAVFFLKHLAFLTFVSGTPIATASFFAKIIYSSSLYRFTGTAAITV
ncbi:hypothetical protein BpHYR1_044891 [Brachionus plicatilis]|uniref:Uncharacterized protein n=1 Tax=Brachionus plicatilis TaxID=10195 RepID=A0A3M7QCF3_BRAPC|nr:hypothetical protein BpHYR1_044891 [Brachionus plicatilis]